MASWSPENTAARLLAYVATGTVPAASGPLSLVLFTTAPTPAGAATDGVEVAGGGYTPESVTFEAPVVATGARIMKSSNTNSIVFLNMPVASTAVVGWGLFDSTLGELVHVNDSWTPAASFAIGDNFLINAGELTLYGPRV